MQYFVNRNNAILEYMHAFHIYHFRLSISDLLVVTVLISLFLFEIGIESSCLNLPSSYSIPFLRCLIMMYETPFY